MDVRAVKPWHVAALVAALIALMVAAWPLGLGRDYMNHLARTFIQANIGSDLALQEFYAVSFDFIPDLTMDLIIPWLSKLVGIYAAGGVTIWLAYVLAPLAGIALSKSLHGRVTWLSLFGFLTVFNGNMDFGFVNYAASSGLAIFAFVLWTRMPPSLRRTLVFSSIGLFLVVNHALAFLTFGFLVLVWEIVSFAKQERGSNWQFLRQLVLVDFPAMVPALVFLMLSLLGASELPQGVSPLYSASAKMQTLFAATQFHNPILAAVLAAAIIGFFTFGIREGWLQFAPKMGWVCGAFLALVILVPSAIFGIWGLHLRFVAPLIILVAASVTLTPKFETIHRSVCASVFAVLGGAMMINGAVQMARLDAQAGALSSVLADLPEGATVLNVFSDPGADTAFTSHAASLAVIERSAFIPNLFTNTSPGDVTSQMVDLHMPQALPAMADNLSIHASRPAAESQNGYWSPYFADAWPERWDYLLVFSTPDFTGLEDLPVCAVSTTDGIFLYKTQPCET